MLGTTFGGGNWPPLVAVTAGMHDAGHTVTCFGDADVAKDFASAGVAVEVVSAEEPLRTFVGRWAVAGASGPSPMRAWAEACLPAVRALVSRFKPHVVLSELFAIDLAMLTKANGSLPWCFINPGYYVGPDSRRTFEEDYARAGLLSHLGLAQAMTDADLVLHATDPLFDPPPASLPRHHHYVGPLLWERPGEVPAYLDDPGAPWVLVTLSSAPQEGEVALARAALRTLAELPVRVVLTLTLGHPRSIKEDELDTIPANARIEGFVPHSEVLKRSRLMVSHAGHGIVAKALTHGVPMVLVPWARDQPGVAARAAALGVAEVVAREDLTEQRLSAAIRRVMDDPRYRENATRVARHLQAQDPVALARKRIEELLATTGSPP